MRLHILAIVTVTTALLSGCTSTAAPDHTAQTAGPIQLRDQPDRILASLVTQITNTEADQTNGTYAYIYTQRWHADTTASHPDPNNVTVIPMRQQIWRAADGSGRQHTCRLPGVPAAKAAALITSADFSSAACTQQDYLRGGLATAIEQPSIDPDQLMVQIRFQKPESGAAGVLRAVVAAAEGSYLDRSQRAAILTVLSRVDRLTVSERQRDPLGRDAVTVRVTPISHAGARTTDELLLDPHTGSLLAYRITTATADAGTIPDLVMWVTTSRVPQTTSPAAPSVSSTPMVHGPLSTPRARR